MNTYRLLVLLVVSLGVCVGALADPPKLGLSVRADGALVKDGKPFRGIGVDYFSAFYRTLIKADDTSYDAGFQVLQDMKIPFVRMIGEGFWPSEMKLYFDNPAEYFRRFDAVVRSAEKHGIGLIPSLCWNTCTFPDLAGEPCDQWGNPQSKTIALMQRYTKDVVTRYLNSPAIWGWEFGNEYNLSADLPNASEWRPPVVPDLGTAKSRSARDELTHDMVRTAFAEFAKEVRKYDPDRIIDTGSGFPRASAWHQRQEKSWTKDTPEQYAEMLVGDNPDPVDVISVHAYGDDVNRIAETMEIARKAHKPLFAGEFGVEGAKTDKSVKEFTELLQTIEDERVPLAALWVYDHNDQDKSWNVTATNERAWQLQAVAKANERIRAEEGR